jgi:hypothetical protein
VIFIHPSETLDVILKSFAKFRGEDGSYKTDFYKQCAALFRQYNGGSVNYANPLTATVSWLPTYDKFGIYLYGSLAIFKQAFQLIEPPPSNPDFGHPAEPTLYPYS